jgi:hypothetical protein
MADMTSQPARRPGDQILDRYVPHLKGADRELARERLQGLARLLLRIAMRQVREEMDGRDSHQSAGRGKILPPPS